MSEPTLKELLDEIDRGELGRARAVFAEPGHEAWREEVARRIEERLERAYKEGDYGVLQAVERDHGFPEVLRRRAFGHVFGLDHRPAGPEHRAFLRIHGVKSIDDIED